MFDDDFLNEYDFPDDYETEFAPDPIFQKLNVTDYARESASYWQMIPVPEFLSPTEFGSLSSLSDADLLNVPVSMLCHLLRTEASDGLQVVSPRQTPLAMCAGQTKLTTRTTDMYLVGSRALINAQWPTVDGFETSPLVSDEPLDFGDSVLASREKTRRDMLTSVSGGFSDPVTKAFVTARSLCDLMRRPDVSGDGDSLAALYSRMWGVDHETMTDMAYASLAPPGDLLRYAIGADTAYPMLNSPLHARACISVGTMGHSRLIYGENSAMDWRRLRVMCEAVFYNTCRVEGHTLADASPERPPGDPNAPPLRPGILQFRPMPGTVWTTDPRTFRLSAPLNADIMPQAGFTVLRRVSGAIENFMEMVTPLALAASKGARVNVVPTRVVTRVSGTSESLITGYVSVMRTLHTFTGRGRTAAAAVRNFIYQALLAVSDPLSVRALWVIWRVRDLARDLGIATARDIRLTHEVATRFAATATDLRQKIIAECVRRGSSLGDWWDDIRSVMPRELMDMAEGTASWSVAMAWLCLNPPTPKWEALGGAVKHAAMSDLSGQIAMNYPLPARIGSEERVDAALRRVRSVLSARFAAYYGADVDACEILCTLPSVKVRHDLFGKLKVAARMWDIRAKAAATLDFRDTHPGDRVTMIVKGGTREITVTTAPYRAYTRWKQEMAFRRNVRPSIIKSFPDQLPGPVSEAFFGKTGPVFAAPSASRAFRYTSSPTLLRTDIEKTLREIRQEFAATLKHYEDEALRTDVPVATLPAEVIGATDFQFGPSGEMPRDAYSYIVDMPYPEDQHYMTVLESLPTATQDLMADMDFPSAEEVKRALDAAVEQESRKRVREGIV